ncbi:MAG: phenylacetate--CoA ligase family protein [Candidatus Heimdallarchaeota archaeon]
MALEKFLFFFIQRRIKRMRKRIQKNDIAFLKKEITKITPKTTDYLLRFNIINGLKHAAKNSPYYRSLLQPILKELSFKNCKTIFRKIPFTTQEMVKEHPEQFLAVPREKIAALDFTYGSTGHRKVIYNSPWDLTAIINSYVLGFINCGLTEKEVVQIVYSFGIWGVANNILHATLKLGFLALPTGNYLSFQEQKEFIEKFGTTAILGTPSYIYNLAKEITLTPESKKKIKVIMMGGEGLPKHRRKVIEESLGGEIFLNYGLNELGGGIGSECKEHAGYHIFPNFLFEIVNPQTGEPVPDGEFGELVITTLKREAMPLIRYRTGDITRVLPEPCACGLPLPRIDYLKGRVDDRIVIGSAEKYYPSHFDEVLDPLEEVKDYWIEVTEEDGRDTLNVYILTNNGSGELEEKVIQKLLTIKSLKIDIEQTKTVNTPNIVFVSKAPPSAKRRRLVDKRKKGR